METAFWNEICFAEKRQASNMCQKVSYVVANLETIIMVQLHLQSVPTPVACTLSMLQS